MYFTCTILYNIGYARVAVLCWVVFELRKLRGVKEDGVESRQL